MSATAIEESPDGGLWWIAPVEGVSSARIWFGGCPILHVDEELQPSPVCVFFDVLQSTETAPNEKCF
jgi:hypothetical protein